MWCLFLALKAPLMWKGCSFLNDTVQVVPVSYLSIRSKPFSVVIKWIQGIQSKILSYLVLFIPPKPSSQPVVCFCIMGGCGSLLSRLKWHPADSQIRSHWSPVDFHQPSLRLVQNSLFSLFFLSSCGHADLQKTLVVLYNPHGYWLITVKTIYVCLSLHLSVSSPFLYSSQA